MKNFFILKPLLKTSLLTVSPRVYERFKSWEFGLEYPDYFNATESIFIHVPKAAGTSVATALYGTQVPHNPAHRWREINPRKFARFFKFAIVRDPVARFVSAFDWLKEHECPWSRKWLAPFNSANELALALADRELQSIVLAWPHFSSQCHYIADTRGQSQMDLLLRFEDLAPGFAEVARKLNCDGALPRLNVRSARSGPLCQEAVRIIESMYDKDFPLWHSA